MPTAQAHLALPFGRIGQDLLASAQKLGIRTEETADQVTLFFMRGNVVITGDESTSHIQLTSDTGAGLQMLSDTVAEKGLEAGITIRWDGAKQGGLPANMSRARITSVARLSPAYTRVVMEGDDLARFCEGPLHFRLLFGPEGASWPHLDANGVTHWPESPDAWHKPVYTTREIESREDGWGRITFDVFLHEGGRVTDWAAADPTGTEIVIMGPAGGKRPAQKGWMALFGDETAVPVVARILAGLDPETRGHAVLQVPEASDIQTLSAPSGMAVTWLLRSEDGTLLEQLKALDVPEHDRFIFLASEKAEATAAREWAKEQGFERGETLMANYWTTGG